MQAVSSYSLYLFSYFNCKYSKNIRKYQIFSPKLNKPDASICNTRTTSPNLVLANDRDELYIFNDEANGGYVIVSGDERMPDILGFSFTGFFDPEDIPCNKKAWMEGFASQIIYLREHPEATMTRQTPQERQNIDPLLTCSFDQTFPYNNKCPVVSGIPCPTGCNATAMAQVMYYYQWPKQTTDTIPGYSNSQGLEMPDIPITTIDWDNTLPSYPQEIFDNLNSEQIDAISTLMLLCGASVRMNYNPSGSGAVSSWIPDAFRNYFDYDEQIERVLGDYYTYDEWDEMIFEELNDGHPILLGTGVDDVPHQTVIDGYKDGYYHVNWGWGGLNDNYYLLTHLDKDEIIIGILPKNDNYPNQYAVLDNGKLTLYYDNERNHRKGTILSRRSDWPNYTEDILNIEIDESFSKLKKSSLNRFFEELTNLKTIDGIENLNTTRAQTMNSMFNNCKNLTNLDVSGFNTEKVTNMSWMFGGCSSLTCLDMSGFKTDNVEKMYAMFYGCSNLTELDISGFHTEKVTDMTKMFYACKFLSTIYVSDSWNMANVEQGEDMFKACNNLVGEMGTMYDSEHTGLEYAHIDGGLDNPGYFKYKESTEIYLPVAKKSVCPAVYSLSGVKVRPEGKGAEGLPAGIYIVGGKKMVIR